jgi:hypothetical protein
MNENDTRDPAIDAHPDQRSDKAKVWRAPRLEITTIAAATAAKGNNPVEVGPATGPHRS